MLLIFFQFYLATAPFREGYYWTTKIHSANCELKSGKYLNEEFFAANSALADVSNSEELWTFNLLHHSRHSPSSVTTYLNTKKSKKILFCFWCLRQEACDARKKSELIFVQKKSPCFGCVVEWLIFINAGPKKVSLSYLTLTGIKASLHISDFCFLIIAIRYDKHLAAGHFQKNQRKLSKNESEDAHICNFWTKYFMYILSILKFGIVCLFSEKIDKITIG